VAGRGAPSTWTVAGATVGTYVFVEVLHVWFGAATTLLAPAGRLGVLGLLALVVGTLALGPLSQLVERAGPRARFAIGLLVLAVGRAGLVVLDHGWPLVATASLAVAGGAIAICGLAGGARDATAARLGMLLGLTSWVVVHASLSTLDLVWRTGVPATLASLALVAALVAVVRPASQGLVAAEGLGGAAWPWATFGPVLLLVGTLSGAPGRVAVAVEWSDAAVATVVVLAHGAAVLAAVLGPRLAGAAGPSGAALVMVGTAGALEPDGVLTVVAQVLLAVGIGLVLAATTRTVGTATSRRRGSVIGWSVTAFGLVAVLYHAAYLVNLGVIDRFDNRTLLLLAAAVHAGIGVAAGLQARRRPTTTTPGARATAVALAATSVVAAVTAVAVAPTTTVATTLDVEPPPVRVVLHDASSGYAPDGRFAVAEAAAAIAAEEPDVVLLTGVDRGWLLHGGHDVLRLFADRIGLPYAFVPAADEVHGNALLTRYPVVELSTERLPRTGDVRARGQLTAVLQLTEDEQLAVVGTQLADPSVSVEVRLPQARAVAANVARLRERGLETVVLGHLTSDPDGPELATFGNLVTLRSSAMDLTTPAAQPAQPAQQVLASDGLVASALTVPEVVVSEHRPVVLTLTKRSDTS
jgi:endonuclease/exonuclease/phosphatase family metal-dependent hydrolase